LSRFFRLVPAITAEDSFILRFGRDAYNAKVEGVEVIDEGVEKAFEVVASLKSFLSFNN